MDQYGIKLYFFVHMDMMLYKLKTRKKNKATIVSFVTSAGRIKRSLNIARGKKEKIVCDLIKSYVLFLKRNVVFFCIKDNVEFHYNRI